MFKDLDKQRTHKIKCGGSFLMNKTRYMSDKQTTASTRGTTF